MRIEVVVDDTFRVEIEMMPARARAVAYTMSSLHALVDELSPVRFESLPLPIPRELRGNERGLAPARLVRR